MPCGQTDNAQRADFDQRGRETPQPCPPNKVTFARHGKRLLDQALTLRWHLPRAFDFRFPCLDLFRRSWHQRIESMRLRWQRDGRAWSTHGKPNAEFSRYAPILPGGRISRRVNDHVAPRLVLAQVRFLSNTALHVRTKELVCLTQRLLRVREMEVALVVPRQGLPQNHDVEFLAACVDAGEGQRRKRSVVDELHRVSSHPRLFR